MQTHQYIWKYLQQHCKRRFVVNLAIVTTLAFLGTLFALTAHTGRAQAYSACPANDRMYVTASGDTLNGIASRYGTNWSLLATYNHIASPDQLYVNQSVCIPVRASANVLGSSTQVVTQQSGVSLSYLTPHDASVANMINQVFGADAVTATRVALCESGLNPAATNPSSGAAGVFQIMPGTWRGTSWAAYSPYNAWANVNAAHEIFARDGHSWREWTCR